MSTQATTGAGERHTPGPWTLTEIDNELGRSIMDPRGAYRVAIVHTAGGCRDEANARLIAAAPAMFAALQMALPLMEARFGSRTPVLAQIRAALSLAMDGGTHAPSEQQEAGR